MGKHGVFNSTPNTKNINKPTSFKFSRRNFGIMETHTIYCSSHNVKPYTNTARATPNPIFVCVVLPAPLPQG